MAADLKGRWAGHYVQRGERRGIRARLTQEGGRVSGTMHDEQTEFSQSLFEMAAEAGLPPGADEQIISRLREQFPDDPGAPISASMTLPPESVLEGTVEGRTVSFLKTYQGDAFSGFQIGSRRVGLSVSGHGVHYRGEVSADGETIEGQWWLEPDPGKGVTRRAEGSFLLRRRREGPTP